MPYDPNDSRYQDELNHCRKMARIVSHPYLLLGVDDDTVGCTTVFELPHDWKGLIHVSDSAPVEFQAVNTRLPFVTERYSSLKELMDQTRIEFGTRYDPFDNFGRERAQDRQADTESDNDG